MQTSGYTPHAGLIRNVYISTSQRDSGKYASASEFTVELPVVLKKVHAVRIRNFKYTPEPLINANNNTISITYNGVSGSGTSTITLPKGDYDQDITMLLSTVNARLNSYDVAFTQDPSTQLINLVFTNPDTTSNFQIEYCGLLKMLGFTNGVYIYSTGTAPSLPSNVIAYGNSASASIAYDVVNDTNLILRIAGLEAIFSIDQVSHRATAILMSNRSSKGVAYYLQEWPYPLLQVQHRIQVLRVQIFNSSGVLYDLNNGDASFMIEFHCLPENPPCEQ